MPALDLKKTFKEVYAAGKAPELVTVPDLNYLMIDGHGDPNTSPAYHAALETLYPVAYTLKFRLKARGLDYAVMPLEGLWWMGDNTSFDQYDREAWKWTLMIAVPEEVTREELEGAIAELRKKKKDLPSIDKLRLERLHEGRAAQIMHVGPYSEEAPTIERLHAYIQAEGKAMTGKHHEVYLGDPRRSAPEKLKTIIRHPVRET